MDLGLQQKVYVLTGATRGLGMASAREFASAAHAGAAVALLAAVVRDLDQADGIEDDDERAEALETGLEERMHPLRGHAYVAVNHELTRKAFEERGR